MKKLFKKDKLIDILFIFFLSLAPLFWFRTGMIMVGHDNVFPLLPQIFLQGRLSTWIEHNLGIAQHMILGSIPIHFIDALPSMLGFDLQLGQIMVYVFWFFLMGISAYILAREINPKSRVFMLTAVVLYQFNFFILQGWWIGERTKFSAYVALPLVLAVLFKVYRNKLSVLHATIFISLILFFFNGGGLYGIPLFGGFYVIYITFILFFSIVSFFRKQYGTVRRLFLVTMFSIISFFLVNAYYIIPPLPQLASQYSTRFAAEGGLSGVISWASEISANSSYINLFRLHGVAEWYDNPEHPYSKHYLTNPFLIVASFIWPLLAVFPLVFVKKKEKLELVLFFFIAYLLGIFFTAGTYPPFGFIYVFLLKTIPGFVIFKSAYFKFAPALFFGVSFLAAYSLDYFQGKARKIFFLLFLIIVFLYHYPYFTGDFFSWRKGFSTRLNLPEYVFEFGDWLNREKEDVRVLLVPPNDPDFRYSKYKWGYLSFQSIPTLLSNKSTVINNDKLTIEEQKLVKELYTSLKKNDNPLFLKLASILGITHVLFQEDTVEGSSFLARNQEIFKQALLDRNNFQLVKKMGAWGMYKIDRLDSQKLFITDKMYSLSIDLEAISKYNQYLQNPVNFVLENGEDRSLGSNILKPISHNLVVPLCLSCPEKNPPVIQFPQRNILPDSPFYPLILFFEKRSVRNNSPKSIIYDDIGLSLKRVSEMNQMIIGNKILKKEFVGEYTRLLKAIGDNFEKLQTLKDKIEVAKDINYYLRAERNHLYPNLGTYVNRGEQTVIVGRIFADIARLLEKIKRFVLIEEGSMGRLLQFNIENSGNFEILLRKQELKALIGRKLKLAIQIDGDSKREITNAGFSKENDWISFGEIYIPQGFHTLLLLFPEATPSVVYSLTSAKTEFNTDESNKCFSTRIRNFNSKNTYTATVSFINDFSDNLFMFVWEEGYNKRSLIDAIHLPFGGLRDKKIEELIKTSEDTKSVLIALCAANLSEEFIDSKFDVTVTEVVYPVIILRPLRELNGAVQKVNYKKISPTRYAVSIDKTNMKKPYILVFSQRFDNGWKLSKYNNTHFKANGFANGWILDGHIENLILEYTPQKYFYFGAVVSAVAVFSGIIFLLFDFLKKIKRKSCSDE